MRRLLAVLTMCAATVPAMAGELSEIRDRAVFLSLVEGRDLRISLYNLTLNVLPDGKITGRALGWSISGSWDWKDGYFCREMDWSGMEIGYDCQLVEADTSRMRFTVDRGAGQTALFSLR